MCRQRRSISRKDESRDPPSVRASSRFWERDQDSSTSHPPSPDRDSESGRKRNELVTHSPRSHFRGVCRRATAGGSFEQTLPFASESTCRVSATLPRCVWEKSRLSGIRGRLVNGIYPSMREKIGSHPSTLIVPVIVAREESLTDHQETSATSPSL